jgi:hypothetical protein
LITLGFFFEPGGLRDAITLHIAFARVFKKGLGLELVLHRPTNSNRFL